MDKIIFKKTKKDFDIKEFFKTIEKLSYDDGFNAGLKKAKDLIVYEMLICHHENTPTSRLTSLSNKISKILKEIK